MPRYNKTFELTVEDMDLIETALRENKRALSNQLIASDTVGADVGASLKRISDLLGRLHNQKEFFRPRDGAYLGG